MQFHLPSGFTQAASPAVMGGGLIEPAYVQSTAGNTNTDSGTLAVSYVTSPTANNLLIAVVYASEAGTATSVDSLTGFTAIGAGAFSALGGQHMLAFYKVSTGAESGTTTATCFYEGTLGRRIAARMFEFSGTKTSGTPYEDLDQATQTTSTSMTQVPVTTAGAARLVVHCAALALVSTTVSAFTGETGGNLVEPVAEYAPTGTTISVQTASMPSAATITGGTATLGLTAETLKCAFALIPR